LAWTSWAPRTLAMPGRPTPTPAACWGRHSIDEKEPVLGAIYEGISAPCAPFRPSIRAGYSFQGCCCLLAAERRAWPAGATRDLIRRTGVSLRANPEKKTRARPKERGGMLGKRAPRARGRVSGKVAWAEGKKGRGSLPPWLAPPPRACRQASKTQVQVVSLVRRARGGFLLPFPHAQSAFSGIFSGGRTCDLSAATSRCLSRYTTDPSSGFINRQPTLLDRAKPRAQGPRPLPQRGHAEVGRAKQALFSPPVSWPTEAKSKF
jgi:hypothetical protein